MIPKIHAPDLLAISATDLAAVTMIAQRIARGVHQAFAPDGICIMQTNGAAAGQTVFHYHVHIIPMQEGQRIGTHGHEHAKPEQLKALAASIATALRS